MDRRKKKGKKTRFSIWNIQKQWPDKKKAKNKEATEETEQKPKTKVDKKPAKKAEAPKERKPKENLTAAERHSKDLGTARVHEGKSKETGGTSKNQDIADWREGKSRDLGGIIPSTTKSYQRDKDTHRVGYVHHPKDYFIDEEGTERIRNSCVYHVDKWGYTRVLFGGENQNKGVLMHEDVCPTCKCAKPYGCPWRWTQKHTQKSLWPRLCSFLDGLF